MENIERRFLTLLGDVDKANNTTDVLSEITTRLIPFIVEKSELNEIFEEIATYRTRTYNSEEVQEVIKKLNQSFNNFLQNLEDKFGKGSIHDFYIKSGCYTDDFKPYEDWLYEDVKMERPFQGENPCINQDKYKTRLVHDFIEKYRFLGVICKVADKEDTDFVRKDFSNFADNFKINIGIIEEKLENEAKQLKTIPFELFYYLGLKDESIILDCKREGFRDLQDYAHEVVEEILYHLENKKQKNINSTKDATLSWLNHFFQIAKNRKIKPTDLLEAYNLALNRELKNSNVYKMRDKIGKVNKIINRMRQEKNVRQTDIDHHIMNEFKSNCSRLMSSLRTKIKKDKTLKENEKKMIRNNLISVKN